MRTAIGVIVLEKVERVAIGSITELDARKAGFEDRVQLVKALRRVTSGSVYKVRLKYESEDPRIALRSKTALTDEDFKKVESKLACLIKIRTVGLLFLSDEGNIQYRTPNIE